MFKKGGTYINILMTETILKIVQVKGTGVSAKISNVSVENISGVPDSEVSSILKKALSACDTKSAQTILTFPSSMISTKNIDIPSVDPEEIKSIVSLQAARHTPYSRSEIQIGYIPVGISKSKYTKVLLVIANRNMLNKQLALLEKNGLKAKKILFAAEGIAHYYAAHLKRKKDVTPTGIIDIGKDSTDFLVMLKGLPIATRSIPIGNAQLSSEGELALNKLVDELGKTVQSYLQEDIAQSPEIYILTGNDELTKRVEVLLKDKFGWSIKIVPFENIIKASSNILQQLRTSYSGHSFLDVIASSAMIDQAHVDLMPEEVLLQKSVEAQGKEVFKTAVFTLVILVIVACTLGLKWYFRSTFLNKMKDKYSDNRSAVMSLENRAIKTKIVQKFTRERMVSLDTISELYRNIPDQIYLTSVLMDEEGNVNIQGISEIASLVFNLGTQLKESEMFQSVNIKSTTAKKDRGKDVSAFEITLKLNLTEQNVDDALLLEE